VRATPALLSSHISTASRSDARFHFPQPQQTSRRRAQPLACLDSYRIHAPPPPAVTNRTSYLPPPPALRERTVSPLRSRPLHPPPSHQSRRRARATCSVPHPILLACVHPFFGDTSPPRPVDHFVPCSAAVNLAPTRICSSARPRCHDRCFAPCSKMIYLAVLDLCPLRGACALSVASFYCTHGLLRILIPISTTSFRSFLLPNRSHHAPTPALHDAPHSPPRPSSANFPSTIIRHPLLTAASAARLIHCLISSTRCQGRSRSFGAAG